MRSVLLAMAATLALSSVASAQEAPHSQDAPLETKTQTANTAPQKVNETQRSQQHEQDAHWTDAMNTTHSKDPRKKDEYGTPLPTPPKGQGTGSSTDAQRAVDAQRAADAGHEK